MIREEAKHDLQALIDYFKEEIGATPVCLKYCAEMLDQEPCTDAVSRDAVIAWFCNQRCGCGCVDRKSCPILVGIRELPPVTQKLETVTEFADRCRECGKMRKGHWIYDETIENWRCSKCNETPKTMGYVGTADFMAEHFKFCNHCGAKMDEPQESDLEKRKPCINYSDGCEEWAGCPCVYYKAESEE